MTELFRSLMSKALAFYVSLSTVIRKYCGKIENHKNEFYNIAFRKKIYTSLEELKPDVDRWIAKYNTERPHSGKHFYGKTPMQIFREAIKIAAEKTIPAAYESDSVENLTNAI